MRRMDKELQRKDSKIGKRTEALHNLEKLLENSIWVFSQLETFAERTLDGLVIIRDVDSPESRFVYANPAMERILGFTQDELISRPWRDFLVTDGVGEQNVETVTQALVAGQPVRRVIGEYRCKDGTTKLLSVSSCPSDELGYIYAVFREVS
jgi:PAS domain S-box-containing protein